MGRLSVAALGIDILTGGGGGGIEFWLLMRSRRLYRVYQHHLD